VALTSCARAATKLHETRQGLPGLVDCFAGEAIGSPYFNAHIIHAVDLHARPVDLKNLGEFEMQRRALRVWRDARACQHQSICQTRKKWSATANGLLFLGWD
jgi:hypothetical protein